MGGAAVGVTGWTVGAGAVGPVGCAVDGTVVGPDGWTVEPVCDLAEAGGAVVLVVAPDGRPERLQAPDARGAEIASSPTAAVRAFARHAICFRCLPNPLEGTCSLRSEGGRIGVAAV